MIERLAAIVGTGFAGREAATMLGTMKEGDEPELERRPTNEHDANAIAVKFGGVFVGWIPKVVNPPVAEAMDAGKDVRAVCVRAATVNGAFVKTEAMLRLSYETEPAP